MHTIIKRIQMTERERERENRKINEVGKIRSMIGY